MAAKRGRPPKAQTAEIDSEPQESDGVDIFERAEPDPEPNPDPAPVKERPNLSLQRLAAKVGEAKAKKILELD